MSRYRRNSWDYNTPTKVTIHWSQKASAFAIKFMDTHHWDEMQIFIQYLKNIPYGERDYDPENKIWYLIEKHVVGFKQMIEMIPQHFTLDYQEKPVGQTSQSVFIPMEVWLDKFKNLTSIDIRTIEYTIAKKAYRRACMRNHPDLGGDAKVMSEINECWSNIEKEYYKQKQEPEYAQQ